MARRKNAYFTGDALHGDGPRGLVEAFYAEINHAFPGSTRVPIPRPATVHPTHDSITQTIIFTNYAVRKFAPIALDAAGAEAQADKLRKLPKIVDEATANAAVAAAKAAVEQVSAFGYRFTAAAADAAVEAAYAAANVLGNNSSEKTKITYIAACAADAACNAAELNPDEIWAAVNEMLAAL